MTELAPEGDNEQEVAPESAEGSSVVSSDEGEEEPGGTAPVAAGAVVREVLRDTATVVDGVVDVDAQDAVFEVGKLPSMKTSSELFLCFFGMNDEESALRVRFP